MNIRPTKAQALEYAGQYKTVPLSAEMQADISPVDVLRKVKKISSHCYMLES